MQILETPRLVLRYFTIRDAQALLPILADPQVMEFSIIGVHDQKHIRQFIEQRLMSYLVPGFGLYALIYQQNQQLIGYCGFFVQQVNEIKEVEIGYRLAAKYWGQGLATEAAKAVLEYGQKRFKFKRFVCLIDPANIRSIRVAQKLGMDLEKEVVYHGINAEMYSLSIELSPL
jgi:[ribosomal protein S5]-alanine N-acetyltransferase